MRTPSGFTLLLGGARSGKSDLASRLAGAWGGPVTFVATAELDGDEDFSTRIALHRTSRPAHWHTVEEPRALWSAVHDIDPGHLVLVDCVSVWVSNLMYHGLTEAEAPAAADRLADALLERAAPSIAVSNEVGLGVHPSSPLGREYRDVLGRVNRRLAERANRALFVAAGHVLPLVAPEEHFA